ncbi:hypothetical protein IG631_01886 [Alternaria alternata]|nr:hypothetical protein IG631_01886 [Alternaria alternata]
MQVTTGIRQGVQAKLTPCRIEASRQKRSAGSNVGHSSAALGAAPAGNQVGFLEKALFVKEDRDLGAPTLPDGVGHDSAKSGVMACAWPLSMP